MKHGLILAIIAMAVVVIASNVLVQFLCGPWLTYGAFTYPLVFLITDVANRLYGANAARQVVLGGFCIGIMCSLVGSQIILQFGAAVALRVGVASAIAFIIAQLCDVAIFERLRAQTWWRAPLVSSIIGSFLDTALFFTIAFSAALPGFSDKANIEVAWAQSDVAFMGVGTLLPLWVSLAFADWLVKLGISLSALIPFRFLVRWGLTHSTKNLTTKTG